MPSKIKPKTIKPKEDDNKQSARFIETARELGADKSAKQFEDIFSKIVPPKRD